MKRLIAYIVVFAMILSVMPAVVSAADTSNLSSRLLAEYNFDNQTTNDAVGSNHATFYNNAEAIAAGYTDGISGKALKLSTQGTEEKYWLSVPYSAFGSNTDSFTISLWYNATGHNTAGENSELFSLYNSSAEKFLFYGAQIDGSANAFTMKWDGTYGYANVIGGYKENEWVHLVFAVDVVDGQSKITSYINGQAVEVDQGGAWANSLMSQMGINTFTIGGKNPYKGGATPNCLFYGSVDEVQIYAGALNAGEAAAVYNAVINPPAQRGQLLASYNFDDETTNDGVGSNNATFYDNATATNASYVSGVSGKALKLSTQGTNEKYWLSVPYSAFGSNTDSFTISLWYNATGHNTAGENSELFSLYNSSAEKFLFYGAQIDGSANAFTMKWDGTYGYANVIGGYKENEWVHLVFAVDNVDGQSVITAYVNGKAVEVDQGGAWANSLMSQMGINTFTIGGKNPYKGGATPNCLFYGSVDEVQIYAGALTATEAADIYNAIANPPAQRGDLLAEYNFNDQTTNDSKGIHNAVFYDNATATNANYVAGVSGKALKLSTQGTNEKYWLSVPYSAFGSNTDSFTISLWYNATGHNTSGENSELFSLYNSSAEKFLFYGAQIDGSANAFTMKWDSTYGYANVIGGYKENQWVHLVFAVDNVDGQSVITAYVNGKAVEVDQGGAWANSLMSQMGINTFTIGGKNPYKGGATPNCLFYGSVDEVQIYAGVLTAGEAADIYNAIANPPTQRGDLLAEYNFNDQTTNDSKGIHNATFYNNATAVSAGYVDGISGKALKLSTQGTDEKYWLSVPYSAFGGNTNSFTLSLWYNATGHNTSGENSELFSLYNSKAEKFLFYGAQTDGSANAFTMKWDGTYGYANVIGGYKENQWMHLVFVVDVVDGQSKITAYVNGKAVEVDQGGAWADSLMSQLGIDTFTIGGKNPYKGGATPNCLFYGYVDEVQIYAGALTAEEARAIYGKNAGAEAADGMGSVSYLQTTLSDGINLSLYTTVTSQLIADPDAYAKITVDGEEKTVSLKNATTKIIGTNTYFVFTVNVAAAQMTEEITLQLFNGAGEGGDVYTCSVQGYAQTLLASQEYAACHDLVKNLLNYGAKAQAYFDVNTDKLANAGNEIQVTNAVPVEPVAIQAEGTVSGISFYGATLLFKDKIAVRYYFTAENGVEGLAFQVNGKDCQPVEKDGKYYVEIGGINPQQYSEVITATVSDGTATLSVNYSPMTYIVRMYNGAASANLKALLEAMYNYHLEAVAYAA